MLSWRKKKKIPMTCDYVWLDKCHLKIVLRVRFWSNSLPSVIPPWTILCKPKSWSQNLLPTWLFLPELGKNSNLRTGRILVSKWQCWLQMYTVHCKQLKCQGERRLAQAGLMRLHVIPIFPLPGYLIPLKNLPERLLTLSWHRKSSYLDG